jgi:hypothetical protein
MMMRPIFSGSVAALSLSLSLGCGSNEEPYKAETAWTGRKANLPAPPTVQVTIKNGDAYTVAGVQHHLRSVVHGAEVNKKELTIEGYIVESNIETAPACALHATGKADPESCKTEIPSFWISDTKDGKGSKIRVLGFAKNFPVIFDAMKKYKGLKEAPKELIKDEANNVDVPFPLPAVQAKVRVTGVYGFSTGQVADPVNGVMTYKKMTQLEAAPKPASFNNAKM